MAKVSEVAKPSETPALDVTKLMQRSSAIVGNDAWWLLYGPPAHGKTTAAATAAKNCPKIPHTGEIVQLDGVAWWLFDKNGTDSLHWMGVDVPVIDFSRCTTKAQVRAGVNHAAEATKQMGCHTVVVDTFSTMDKIILADLSPAFNGGSKFGLYNAVLAEHTDTLRTLRGLDCTVLFLAHSKAKSQFKDGSEYKEMAERKDKAGGLPGSFEVGLDITGQSLDFMTAQCSYIIPVVAEKAGKREPDYALYPYGYPGFAFKCRYPGFKQKEEPNLYRMIQQTKGVST